MPGVDSPISPEARSYATFLRNLRDRFPKLINVEHELIEPAPHKRDCRVRLIDLPPSAETGREFHSPPELREHFGATEVATPAQGCRIYVVENLSLEYITVLGNHFELDPTIFASQIQSQVWSEHPRNNNTAPLIQDRHPMESFTLRYTELRYFLEPIAGISLVDNKAGRKITSTIARDELKVFHHVGAIRRCISFWCRKRPGTHFWDGNTPS